MDLAGDGNAGEVHEHHGVDARTDRGLERVRRHVQRVGIHVDEYGRESRGQDGRHRRDEGPRGDGNSCTTGKIKAPERDFERGGARRRRDGIMRAEVVGQLLLEGPALEAGREPSAAQHAHDGVDVLVADAGIHELQRLHHGLSVPHVVNGALECLDLAMERRARAERAHWPGAARV